MCAHQSSVQAGPHSLLPIGVGYDVMGYNLSKPFLRAQLEEDLKRYMWLCNLVCAYWVWVMVLPGMALHIVSCVRRICDGVTTKDGESVLHAGENLVMGLFLPHCCWETHCVAIHYMCMPSLPTQL